MTPKQEAALQAITYFDQMREAPCARQCEAQAFKIEIRRLEAELMEQARVNGMGMEREAKLMARVERLEWVCDVALNALETVTKHFTKVPSLLKDSEARGVAHAAIAKLKEMK